MALWKRQGDSEDLPPAQPERTSPTPGPTLPSPTRRPEPAGGTMMANIGKSLSIKGDVEGGEDTVIEGRVEGRISLRSHHLTIGTNGEVQGEVSAKLVTVIGRVVGNVVASDRIEIRESGRVDGDLMSPRLQVTEGAILNGRIVMKETGAQPPVAAKTPGKDSPAAGSAPTPSGGSPKQG